MESWHQTPLTMLSTAVTDKICSECGLPTSAKGMPGHWSRRHPQIYDAFKQASGFYLKCGSLPRVPDDDWATKVMKVLDGHGTDAVDGDAYYAAVRRSIRHLFGAHYPQRKQWGLSMV